MPAASVYTLPYGRTSISVEIGSHAERVEHRGTKPIEDEAGAVFRAIRDPIGTLPLSQIAKPGERVAIIVNDITRLTRTDLLLPPIVQTLNQAGIPDSDIFIVFALGMHREQPDAERKSILGEELFRKIRNFDHICTDESNLVTIGTTSFGNTVHINREVVEADRIILTGEIMYHLIAGYSGGRKSLIPGVAGSRTITFNHQMIFDPRCGPGILDGNPAHEDLLEACRMVEPDFIVNVVLTPDGKLASVVAGHYEMAHRAGCRVVDEVLSTTIREPYNIIIASAGGYPLDIDLRQAHKGLENACRALKPGGKMVFYAECPNGSGHPLFNTYVSRFRGDAEIKQALLEHFEIGGHKAYWVTRLGRLFDIDLVSALPSSFVEQCHLHPVSIQEHGNRVRHILDSAGPSARIGIMPHAGHTLPRVELPQQGR